MIRPKNHTMTADTSAAIPSSRFCSNLPVSRRFTLPFQKLCRSKNTRQSIQNFHHSITVEAQRTPPFMERVNLFGAFGYPPINTTFFLPNQPSGKHWKAHQGQNSPMCCLFFCSEQASAPTGVEKQIVDVGAGRKPSWATRAE